MEVLESYLKTLGLPTVRSCHAEVADQATREGLSYAEFLREVLARECEVRGQNRIERLLHESRLPLEKSLESLDLSRLPLRVRQQLAALRDGKFLDRRENVLVFGNPGSGKTHLLCGLSQALIRRGYRVYYRPCTLLVQELLLAKKELALPRLLKRLGGYQALFLDDLGYVQQSREEMEVLFTLLAERYERGSVLLTSNLPFSRWEEIFKDPMTTAAAIDRLVHHSVIIELNLSSYRMEQAKAAQAPVPAPPGQTPAPGEDAPTAAG
jgi:DNA replication protein DnaC